MITDNKVSGTFVSIVSMLPTGIDVVSGLEVKGMDDYG